MMNIVFCLNKSYLKYFHIAITSLYFHSQKKVINLYVISADITSNDIKELSINYSVNLISVSLDRFKTFEVNEHLSIETYFRLLIPELIEEDKCLYLDSDIVINGDVESLYNTEISSYLLAAVPERPSPHLNNKLSLPQDNKYFNAGVLLLNLKKLRKENVFNKAVDYIRECPNSITYHDQCAINWATYGSVLHLGTKYNVTKSFVNHSTYAAAVVIHFDGPIKPWHYNGRKELRLVYQKYLKMANPKYRAYDDLNIRQILSRHVPNFLKRILLRKLSRS
ncbi:MAG: glycosyltransferase family 8 protein [Flavobacteriales bacterium]|nr:glycosyltransferase family 8 protein [Flavobacteriales bacterium]